MNSLFILIGVSLLIGLAAILLFVWGHKSEQFDDTEGAKHRMMDDDDDDI